MLKDELKLLAQLAAGYNLAAGIANEQTIAYLREQESRIKEECQRIRKAWTELLFSQAREEAIRRYVWFQQQVLLELANQLHEQINRQPVFGEQEAAPNYRLAAYLMSQLLALRDFQIQYFNAYINEAAKVPDAVIPDIRKKMVNLAEQLSANLLKVELDAGLKLCILEYLGAVITTDLTAGITYRFEEYFYSFAEIMSVTIDFKDNRDLTHSITQVLFYINFNQSDFCQWYREMIIAGKAALRPQDQLPMLNSQLLLLKSTQVMLTMSFDPLALPVSSQLEKWLNEYIRLEATLPEIADGELPHKIELKLTVAQLALLIRLLYEEGVFAMKNIAALLKFFSRHFMSKKQEHISYSSMNKLYYTGDQFTAYAIRELLLKMVAKINKMFFPV